MIRFDLQATAGDFALDAKATLSGSAAVLGANGAGKSTLVRSLTGLIDSRGTFMVGGLPLHDLPPHQRRIGTVFQTGRLFPHLSVEGNLRYGETPGPIGFSELVERLALGALLSRRPSGLSGGETRRVALGRALLCQPRLLVLDEPLAGVDQASRPALIGLIREALERFEAPALWITHDPDEALAVAKDLVLLEAGQVRAAGPSEQVITAEPELCSSLGVHNVWSVRLEGDSAVCGDLRLRAPTPPDAVRTRGQGALALGWNEVVLADSIGRTSARNVLEARVVGRQDRGEACVITLDVGAPLRAEITRQSADDLGLAVGVAVRALVKTQSLRWIG